MRVREGKQGMQVSSSLTLSPAERRLSSELSTRQRRERRNMSFLKSNSLRLRAVLLHCIRRRRADDVARPPLVCFTLHPQIQPRWRVLTMRNISLTLLAPLLPLLVVVVLALSASAKRRRASGSLAESSGRNFSATRRESRIS